MDKIFPYTFFVEIEDIESGRFEKCEGLEAETRVIEMEESGDSTVRKFRGQTRWPNLILQKGICVNNEIFLWYKNHALGGKKLERKNGSIVLKNLSGQKIKRWNFFRAFPCRWIGPRLEGTIASGYAVERIEIAHEGIVLNENIPEKTSFFQIGQSQDGEHIGTMRRRVTKYRFVHKEFLRHVFEASGLTYRNDPPLHTERSGLHATRQEALAAAQRDFAELSQRSSHQPMQILNDVIEIRSFSNQYYSRISGNQTLIYVYNVDTWSVESVEIWEDVN